MRIAVIPVGNGVTDTALIVVCSPWDLGRIFQVLYHLSAERERGRVNFRTQEKSTKDDL